MATNTLKKGGSRSSPWLPKELKTLLGLYSLSGDTPSLTDKAFLSFVKKELPGRSPTAAYWKWMNEAESQGYRTPKPLKKRSINSAKSEPTKWVAREPVNNMKAWRPRWDEWLIRAYSLYGDAPKVTDEKLLRVADRIRKKPRPVVLRWAHLHKKFAEKSSKPREVNGGEYKKLPAAIFQLDGKVLMKEQARTLLDMSMRYADDSELRTICEVVLEQARQVIAKEKSRKIKPGVFYGLKA